MRAILLRLQSRPTAADLRERFRQWRAGLTPEKRIKLVVEWTGASLGLLGSYLLANNDAISGYGWLAFLASNACWLWYGVKTRTWAMVLMQMGFTWTSLKGIQNWLL